MAFPQSADTREESPQVFTQPGQPEPQHAHAASRGFAQMFGLHPGMAFLTFIVDSMLFGGEGATLGASFPVSLAVSVVIGVIVYRAQRAWYGDDEESARLKAGIVALLTAIPTPLPAMLYIPAGIVGLFRRKG